MNIPNEIKTLLMDFFEDDQHKAIEWLKADNPILGGVKPLHMIVSGRSDRLLNWMEEQAEMNK